MWRHSDWPEVLTAPPLLETDVHVWRTFLDVGPETLRRFESILSSGERERAARFTQERDRVRFVSRHGVLRLILGEYTSAAATSLAFEFAGSGKPRLVRPRSDVEFSLSHSHGLALLAITRGHAVGIDVEARRPADWYNEVASTFLSSEELVELTVTPMEQRSDAFLALWTRKEAYVKADGSGLRMPLDSFTLPILSLGGQCQFVLNGRHWNLFSLVPADGYFAAVVVEGEKHAMRQFSFQIANGDRVS